MGIVELSSNIQMTFKKETQQPHSCCRELEKVKKVVRRELCKKYKQPVAVRAVQWNIRN